MKNRGKRRKASNGISDHTNHEPFNPFFCLKTLKTKTYLIDIRIRCFIEDGERLDNHIKEVARVDINRLEMKSKKQISNRFELR